MFLWSGSLCKLFVYGRCELNYTSVTAFSPSVHHAYDAWPKYSKLTLSVLLKSLWFLYMNSFCWISEMRKFARYSCPGFKNWFLTKLFSMHEDWKNDLEQGKVSLTLSSILKVQIKSFNCENKSIVHVSPAHKVNYKSQISLGLEE